MNAPNKPATTDQHQHIPGLSDLLVNAMVLKDPARAEQAAQNILLPVTTGIHAIGDLLTVAASSTEESVERDTLRDVGFLLMFLADLQGDIRNIITSANHDLIQAAVKEGKA